MDENTPVKKLTAASVLKKYGLNPAEADELLEQIYEELEKSNVPEEDED